MPKFGKSSLERLETCDPRLQLVLNGVIRSFDFSVTEGHRPIAVQRKLYEIGRKKGADGTWTKIGHTVTNIDGLTVTGKHNVRPSLAADIAPYPIDYSDRGKARERFYFMMGMVRNEAEGINAMLPEINQVRAESGLPALKPFTLRFGLDWDGDGSFDDQSFDDLPHVEIVEATA